MRSIRLLVFLGAVLLAASAALAHGVRVFAYEEDGEVVARGYFANGDPVVGGKVEAFGPDGTPIASGKTDGEGLFAFPVLKPGEIRIELNALPGHKAETTLTVAASD